MQLRNPLSGCQTSGDLSLPRSDAILLTIVKVTQNFPAAAERRSLILPYQVRSLAATRWGLRRQPIAVGEGPLMRRRAFAINRAAFFSVNPSYILYSSHRNSAEVLRIF